MKSILVQITSCYSDILILTGATQETSYMKYSPSIPLMYTLGCPICENFLRDLSSHLLSFSIELSALEIVCTLIESVFGTFRDSHDFKTCSLLGSLPGGC